LIVSVTVTDNREDQIAGAVRSVAAHVDRVLLVDTGVTDRTTERAWEIVGDRLSIARHQWVDFSTARNAGLDAARDLGAKWVVVVDSDERISFGAMNLREVLERARADVLLVESDDGYYPKEKILRVGANVRYFGPTHEALIGGRRELLRGATFCELPKTEAQIERKLERDIPLLEAFVERHPEDPRWRYYLGVSLAEMGRRERAADAFGTCARLKKTGYEAAWASFNEAQQLLDLDRYDAAIEAAARGMRSDATFAECACVAAEASARAGRKDQAAAWARIAESIGRYRGAAPERLWFRDLPSLYERPYEVLRAVLPDAAGRERASLDCEAAKMARVKAIGGLGDCDLERLSVSRAAPLAGREEARSMLRPPLLSRLCPGAHATRIQFDPSGGRLPMNPSICQHRGELWCVIRAVNYSMDGRHYVVHDPNRIVRTENYLGRLGLDGTFIDPRPMRDLDRSPRIQSQVVGYEDVRLVSVGDALAGSATVCDRDNQGPRIARLHLNTRGDIKRADVQPSNQRYEKNWMPLSVDGAFTWIYSLDPTAILPGPLRACPLALDHLRGGAAIAFKGGYLCVAHETIDEPEGRIYLHRFVKLDKKFHVTAVSPSWVFAHHGIEFCAGLARSGSRLVLSYGVKDREAWIMQVDVKEVEAMKWITP
jgi:tetratricopeptide (TPR) repeat protein